MDIQNKFRSQRGYRSTNQTEINTMSFNCFLTIYAINLVYRYPDVTDLELVDETNVKNIAKLSAACSTIALETWEELFSGVSRRGSEEGTRAA